jgi:hypothetical protein
MSQEWLNIQSFFTDHELIGAINDLSIFLKQEAAGIRDVERASRAEKARQVLNEFLSRLSESESAEGREPVLGVDARFQSLTDAIESAREQNGRYQSVLMREGASSALALLAADAPEARSQLLTCLAELRKIIEQHQQADASVIFEEQ